MIRILQYDFEGPFLSVNELKNSSGVYVILGGNGSNSWIIVDVGESEDVKRRVQDHDRKSCWGSQSYSSLAVAVYYTETLLRMVIEREIRDNSNPPCGER